MADRRVKVLIEAEVSKFQAGAKAAAKATEDLAKSTDSAAAGAGKLEAAQKKAGVAQDRAADAAGRLRIAQEKLNAARESGNPARIVAATRSHCHTSSPTRERERTHRPSRTSCSSSSYGPAQLVSRWSRRAGGAVSR